MPTTEGAPIQGEGKGHPARRVLYVDYSVGFGGATKSLSLVTGALPGVEKFVITCQEPDLIRTWYRDMRVFRFRRLANYRTYSRAAEWFGRVLGRGLMFTAASKLMAAVDLAVGAANSMRIWWLIRRHRIDCVHLNNGFAPLEGMLGARLAGVPCIVHMRGMAVAKRGLDLRESLRVTHAIAVSDAVAATVRRTLGDIPMTTIYDPVDVAVFTGMPPERRDAARRRLGFDERSVVVAMFGRIVRWKGQLEFVRAMTQVMRGDPHVRALVVGDESDGARAYLDEVHQAVAASGYADRFVLTGYQTRVAELYHAADVVVHASIEDEPFGMVVPEAMAAGKPIIAAAAGGPREVVGHGDDGVLVPPGDVPALAGAIRDLCRDAEQRARLGRRGRAKVESAFDVKCIARQLAAVYDRILGAPRP